MSSIPKISDDEYECFTCGRIFTTRVFEITREWDRVHYCTILPEVEVEEAYGLECYCSQACLVARRANVMANESVPIRPAGLEPIETCARCAGPVDMSEFHLAYVESETMMNGFVGITLDCEYLAVVCNRCLPRTLGCEEVVSTPEALALIVAST
ncbi:hypothetical protein [Paraburkholderia flagellata]|uniref:hypothetical protein n=1 Tax=Paraburkholderia flagellata TaxID=2883241 RepID=UPI001F1D6163|nr:hypothetical protein [Paraburkholderia flagellata]